jgi:CheY-like chemotaxis protein
MSDEGRGSAGAPRLDGLRILLVEDETIIALMLEEVLNELGCLVSRAGSVRGALAALAAHTPDAAVLDVNLAGQSAEPVAEALVAAGIPFVFTTGYGRGGISYRWDSRPVLQKPFGPDALATALARALEDHAHGEARSRPRLRPT